MAPAKLASKLSFYLAFSVIAMLVVFGAPPAYGGTCGGAVHSAAWPYRSLLPGALTIPESQRQVLEASYRKGIELAFGPLKEWTNPFLDNINVGAGHSQNYFNGVRHSKVLEELGFKFIRDSDGKPSFQPPATFLEIFANYERHLRTMIKSGVVSETEVIRPALILQKIKDGAPVTPPEYRVFSPAVDAWPGAEWVLATKVPQFSHETYYNFVGSGRMPFAAGSFFNHDLSHLSDMHQSPEVMRQYYLYGRKVMGSVRSSGLKAGTFERNFSMKGDAEKLMAEYRSVIYGEWFTIPDVTKAQRIRRMLPGYFMSRRDHSVDSIKSDLHGLSAQELKARAERVLQMAPSLIISLGGGMKDIRSYYVFDKGGNGMLTRAHSAIRPDHWQAKIKPNFETDANHHALADTLPKWLDQLATLYHFTFSETRQLEAFLEARPEYEAISSLAKSFVDLKRNDADGKLRQSAESALIDQLARLELAFYLAVDLALTPEIAYREGRLSRLSRQDRYFRYLSAIMPASSYTAYAFELNQGLDAAPSARPNQSPGQ
ncbi:MAG TPA: hypothetical protein VFV50_16610 [Bdellovibrionales bacterium]|nr:hypothetical protein [Bdellovibrionales bacterium]